MKIKLFKVIMEEYEAEVFDSCPNCGHDLTKEYRLFQLCSEHQDYKPAQLDRATVL